MKKRKQPSAIGPRQQHLDRFSRAVQTVAMYEHCASILRDEDPLPGQLDQQNLRSASRTLKRELIHVGPFITREQWQSVEAANLEIGGVELARGIVEAFWGEPNK